MEKQQVKRRVLYRYKGDKCAYCNSSVEEKLRIFQTLAGFDFHHLDPTKKDPNYKKLMERKLSGDQFDELDKCALLCTNCHKTLHGQNKTITHGFVLRAEGMEPIVHSLTCQMIENHETGECTLFSDEFRLLRLFKVQTGLDDKQSVKIMSGIQLRPVIQQLMSETRINGPLVIKHFEDDSVVFQAGPNESGSLKVSYDADFPLPITSTIELKTAKQKKSGLRIYVRNGQAIFDFNGNVYMSSGHADVRNTLTASYDAFDDQLRASKADPVD